jgi:mannose-6-phosphate isomerase
LVPLTNSIRPYAWGSTDFIPALLGVPQTGEPAAELWLGAHPAAPSQVSGTDQSLADLVAADPLAALGAATVDRFGQRLPFLLKVLAAASPLSIQAHPTIEQARAGFQEENDRGIPLDAPNRNYVDPNHKPELICALTDFEALCGFRQVHDSASLFAAIIAAGGTGFLGYPQRLVSEGGLREVVTALLTMPASHQRDLQASVLPACAAVAAAGSAWAAECAWAGHLAEAYPGDGGVVLALLMNLVRLQPGQALFLGAGRIHAYLRGAGVEIMASSDNVLRCGLTPKHVDVPELLRVLDFTPENGTPVRPVVHGRSWRYPVPVPDFVLSRFEIEPGEPLEVASSGPQIVLCTEGAVEIGAESGPQLALKRGESAFVSAGDLVTVTGSGQLFVAGTGPGA